MNNNELPLTDNILLNKNIYLIKIASINVNSLISLSKRYDLYNFITENNLNIILVCETKLSTRYKI